MTRLWPLLPLSLLLGAAVSLVLGQDGNWDLLAYHLQNGAALLHGRFWQDLLPVGMQSYLNPLLDASYAYLALGPLSQHPRVLAAVMGLWFGAAVYLAIRLSLLLHGPKWLPVMAGTVLGVTGMAVLPQVGTTTNELQAGTVLLAGLFVLYRYPGAWWSALSAGILFGLTAGLKLTTAAFAPAAALSTLSLCPPRTMLRAGAMFVAGWLGGLLVSDGWWAWQVYQRFGSPVFPMFNGVFRSPWYPPASMVDDRFFPRGWAQWVLYPLFWTSRSGPHAAELPFQDLRGAAVIILALSALLAWSASRLVPVLRRPAFTIVQRAALIFVSVGYLTWLETSSIIRYAVALEIMAGLVLPCLLARLSSGPAFSGCLVAGVALLLVTTDYGPQTRVPYGLETLQADIGKLAPNTLIVVTFRGPSGHALAFLPQVPGLAVMQVGTSVLEARGWPLHDEAVRMVQAHVGPIKVLTEGYPDGAFVELAEIGLSPMLARCTLVNSTLTPASATGLHLCDAARQAPRKLLDPFWRQASEHYHVLYQPGTPADGLAGTAYLDSAGPSARGTRFLDWTDLLWGGLVRDRASLPSKLDPETLYVAPMAYAGALTKRIDPARDMIGQADGWVIAAPGWLDCGSCTARLQPPPSP